MTSKDFLELDHSRIKMGVIEGALFPEYEEPAAEHLPKIKAMDIRDDDILLCSFPKSGTHWMYRVVDMLQRGEAKFVQRNADSTFLDIQNIHAISQLTSPRVLVSHIPFQYLPSQIQNKRTKIVHVYRNPRAVMVSFYFQMKHRAPESPSPSLGFEDMTFDKAAGLFFSEKMAYGGWFKYMDAMQAFKKEHPEQPIFEISYEDMTRNPLDTVSSLGQFLGQGSSAELCADIVKACSFQNQKSQEEKADPNQAQVKFYRKGDMNDWKNHVTVAQNEQFEQILQERAERCSYSAKYRGKK